MTFLDVANVLRWLHPGNSTFGEYFDWDFYDNRRGLSPLVKLFPFVIQCERTAVKATELNSLRYCISIACWHCIAFLLQIRQ